MKRFILTILCIFALTSMNAQIHEVGVFIGGSNFIGDVGPTTYIKPNEAAFGLLYKWNKSPRHSWRFSYMQSKLTSRDIDSDMPNRHDRGYDFETSVKEVSLGLEFNFFDFNLHELDRQITPYVFGGLSYFRYDSQYVKNGVTRIDDKSNSLAIPMVLGVKSNIYPNIILGFEVGVRYTFVDDIDGSTPKKNEYNTYKFGNINSNDWYVFSGFTLTYTFGNKPCYCAD